MKKLLLNYPGIASFIIGFIFLICVSFTETKKDTKVFVSNNSKTIEMQINTWTKYGYNVKSLTAQSISNAYDGAQYTNYSVVEGDLILIMEK